MRLEVEAAADAPTDDDSLAKRADAVRHRVKSMVGVTREVAVKRPGEVPQSEGKARDLRKT